MFSLTAKLSNATTKLPEHVREGLFSLAAKLSLAATELLRNITVTVFACRETELGSN